MVSVSISDISQYIKEQFNSINEQRIEHLKKFELNDILITKNPYLFNVKNVLITHDFVIRLLDEYMSLKEETLLGNFLEGLAIFVNEKTYKGWKSVTQGIDLEFNKEKTRYIVAIKSGPNWGNSSQIRKMQDDFRKAKQTIRTSNSKLHVIAVNGCCYGRNTKPDRGDYYKYCGQKFWEFISGNPALYIEIIKPLGYSIKENNADFLEEYAKKVNIMTQEFSNLFVTNGMIDWESLVQFNSAENKPKLKAKQSSRVKKK